MREGLKKVADLAAWECVSAESRSYDRAIDLLYRFDRKNRVIAGLSIFKAW
jgi:hypothetical protein